VFEVLIDPNLRQAGAARSAQTHLPPGLQVGLGVRSVATSRNFSQGNLQQTSNNLDIAIKGNGFFQVQLPDGTTGYTRDGSLQVDGAGQLVTNNGYVVQPGITIPNNAQSVTIAPDGTVNVALPGQTAPQAVGQLNLASFVNPAGLEPKGQNLWAETSASGSPNAGAPGSNGLGVLQQGCRDQQRRRRRGTRGDDRHQRLRAELEGDPDFDQMPQKLGHQEDDPPPRLRAPSRAPYRQSRSRRPLVAAKRFAATLLVTLAGCAGINDYRCRSRLAPPPVAPAPAPTAANGAITRLPPTGRRSGPPCACPVTRTVQNRREGQREPEVDFVGRRAANSVARSPLCPASPPTLLAVRRSAQWQQHLAARRHRAATTSGTITVSSRRAAQRPPADQVKSRSA
jgi:hypothetical protein